MTHIPSTDVIPPGHVVEFIDRHTGGTRTGFGTGTRDSRRERHVIQTGGHYAAVRTVLVPPDRVRSITPPTNHRGGR